MEKLHGFYKTAGKGVPYARPTSATFRKYDGKIDEALLEEWREHGWCSYADGILWLVDPDLFREALKEWLPGRRSTFVWARSAFGDLLFAGPKGVGHLDVHHGSLVEFEDFGKNVNITIFMELSMKRYLKNDALDGPLTKKALKKFGNLAPDEMFTFEPALALGGGYQLKYVNKVKLFPQLSFLAQLFDEITVD